MKDTPVSKTFYLKNRDPNHWPDVKSFNNIQIGLSKITDSQFLNELRSGTAMLSSIALEIPELNQLLQLEKEENYRE